MPLSAYVCYIFWPPEGNLTLPTALILATFAAASTRLEFPRDVGHLSELATLLLIHLVSESLSRSDLKSQNFIVYLRG